MNNKPVAWLINGKLFEEYFRTSELDKIIPLYPHPVKELTDEEMLEIYKKVFNKKNEFKENLKRRSYFDFARAILKKAQKK